jgi:acetyltransferase-like isoleucine patch superfamily enzyme
MKAYIIRTNRKIEPFGDNASDCLVGNKKLTVWQRYSLLNQGIKPCFVSSKNEIKKGEECLCLNDNLYFTPELLQEFLAKSREKNNSTVCALKKGITTLRTGANLQDVDDCGSYVNYGLKYFPEGDPDAICVSVIIDADQLNASVSVPEHMSGSKNGYAVPVTDKFMIQMDHWVNLWSCNILFVLANVARIRKISKAKLLPWKIFRNLSRIGKGCKINRSAIAEASIIGNNVTIEAGAIVRASIIGDNVHIGNGVVIEESVIGENSSILSGHLLYCAFYPGTFSVTGMISASVIGRDSFLGVNTTLTDFRFDGKNVTVLQDSKKIDSGNLFLGACLGHGVYLGSGCIVAPGRVISNGLRITLDEKRVFNAYASKPEGFRIIDYKA